MVFPTSHLGNIALASFPHFELSRQNFIKIYFPLIKTKTFGYANQGGNNQVQHS